MTCRPPLTLNSLHISLHLWLRAIWKWRVIIAVNFQFKQLERRSLKKKSELYIVYNSRIARLILSNKNVIWILMFSKKTVALNKIIADHNRKLTFWDLNYTPEWFEFINLGLAFLALKKCLEIRKTYCCKFRQAYNTGLHNSQFAISFKPSCRSSKPFYSHGVPIFEISFGVFLFNLFKHCFELLN